MKKKPQLKSKSLLCLINENIGGRIIVFDFVFGEQFGWRHAAVSTRLR